MGARGSKQVHTKTTYLNEGDKVPNVMLKARIRVAASEEVSSFVWKDIMTADLFKGKRVVVFSIPGGKTIPESSMLFRHANGNIDSNNIFHVYSIHSGLFV